METSRIFRPVMNVGFVYARLAGSAAPLQSIGGLEELKIDIKEDVKKQADMSRVGGGTRAMVRRVDTVVMTLKMQDVNVVNLARAVFGTASAVAAGEVDDEPFVAHAGGLLALEHINPSEVVVKAGAATVAAAGNYEVRPEGLFWFDDSQAIEAARAAHATASPGVAFPGLSVTVSYSHDAYDLIEALTSSAPVLEMVYAGVNEAGVVVANGEQRVASRVELFRVQLGAGKSWGLIDKDLGTLEVEGEVLVDPTKSGAGTSRFFRVRQA